MKDKKYLGGRHRRVNNYHDSMEFPEQDSESRMRSSDGKIVLSKNLKWRGKVKDG